METNTVAGANATPDLGVPTSPIDNGFGTAALSADNVSDIDVPAKEEVSKNAQAAGAVKAEPDGKAKEKEDLERFDKHPRFQELNQKVHDLTTKLAEAAGKLEVLTPKGEQPEQPELPFKDITKMTKEDILEWREDDPIGYEANVFQQMLYETRMTLREEQERTQKTTSVRQTYDNYAKDNPDFETKWNSGEIRSFMDTHPGHNAISAHMAMTEQARGEVEKSRIDAAVAKAVKEAEERVIKNFQAKKNAQVISDGGTVKESGGTPDELANPEKYGGATAALALRLSRLRQAGSSP